MTQTNSKYPTQEEIGDGLIKMYLAELETVEYASERWKYLHWRLRGLGLEDDNCSYCGTAGEQLMGDRN